MNNLIIVGSICAYGAVFLLGADTRFVSAAVFEKLCYVSDGGFCIICRRTITLSIKTITRINKSNQLRNIRA